MRVERVLGEWKRVSIGSAPAGDVDAYDERHPPCQFPSVAPSVRCHGRTDHLFRLLQALRVLPAPVTAARLAEETGVSPRSLYRDIESLRAAGAHIEGERG